jgi:outer membrane protein assembly factor BamB
MNAARKIECFALGRDERFAYAGNISGQVVVVDVDAFAIVAEHQLHAGGVYAVAVHPTLPYAATLSQDRHVALSRIEPDGSLRLLGTISNRNIVPRNDESPVVPTQSQSAALAFHPTERKIVTRSGNSALLELSFTDDGTFEVVDCLRVFGRADLYAARYTRDGEAVLSGATDGQIALYRNNEIERRWQLGFSSVHWFAHVRDGEYLIASDMRYVARLSLSDGSLRHGSEFTRDDLEQVTYNQRSGRAFAASFDRNVYEVDPRTCESLGVVYAAPFKLRWLATLERDPDVLLAQIRTGALAKVSLATGCAVAEIRETPRALWTSVVDKHGSIVFAGEGETLIRSTPGGLDPVSRSQRYASREIPLDMSPSYTKRMTYVRDDDSFVLGRTDGRVYKVSAGRTTELARLDGAVRDVAVATAAPVVYAGCESGTVYAIDAYTGEQLAAAVPMPGTAVWAIAYNPVSGELACGGRNGRLTFAEGARLRTARPELRVDGRLKRMKWLDADTLASSEGGSIVAFDVRDGSKSILLDTLGNTVEDFIVDHERGYLLCVSYTCNIALIDFRHGVMLHEVADQMDYSKGLAWLPVAEATAYPYDFVTYGRSGLAHRYRIHDEKIVALGPLFTEESLRARAAAGSRDEAMLVTA